MDVGGKLVGYRGFYWRKGGLLVTGNRSREGVQHKKAAPGVSVGHHWRVFVTDTQFSVSIFRVPP